MSAPRRSVADAAVHGTRRIALALALGPLLLLALSRIAPLEPSSSRLVAPIALIGIVNPLLTYRVYLAQRDAARVVPGGPAEQARRFRRATVLALAVSELAALLSVVGHWVSARPVTLLGLATHVLAAGALWPNEERLAAFGPDRDVARPSP